MSSDAGIDKDGEEGARKLYASLVQDQGRKQTPLPPLNNPMPEQTLLVKNYDKNTRCVDRDPRGIFRTPNDASAPPAAGLIGPLGTSSFSLPTQTNGHTDITYPRKRAKPDAARGSVELLQEPAESQGPRGAPRNLGGEPWCWYYSW
ncbi:hypothetical protein EI94DRAFT_1811115 [Lactarius quietus]|nr:hypothetical protein EI94DRAFT_1811115 [Lactarius quietus]